MAREEGFFDDLARGLADGTLTRGKALRLMGAALVGGSLGSLGIHEAGADPPGCKRSGKHCTRDPQCCGSLVCVSGTCQTPTTTTTETPTTTTTETPTTTTTETPTTTTTPMCIPNGGTCSPGGTPCCSGNCSNGTCACPAGRVLLDNGTCARPCPDGDNCIDCAGGCTFVTATTGYCATTGGTGQTCTADIDCLPGQFCYVLGFCIAAC
jgi:hypothetical protein